MDRNTEASIRTLRGPKGDKGDPGAGLTLKGRLDDPNLLPPYPEDGDAFLIGDDMWVTVNGLWTNAGPVRGPQGERGPRGPQGLPGAIGVGLVDGGTPESVYGGDLMIVDGGTP